MCKTVEEEVAERFVIDKGVGGMSPPAWLLAFGVESHMSSGFPFEVGVTGFGACRLPQ